MAQEGGPGSQEGGPGGCDLSKLSAAGKILGIAGILYFIDLWLPWQHAGACADTPFGTICAGESLGGYAGIGWLNFLLVIAIVAMEVLVVAGVKVNIGTAEQMAMVSAGLAWALGVFTIIKVIIILNEAIYLFAWIGLILAIVIAYGGYMRWQEGKSGAAPAAGGSFGE